MQLTAKSSNYQHRRHICHSPDDSSTNQLAVSQVVYWSTRRLDDSWTSQLAEIENHIRRYYLHPKFFTNHFLGL